MDLTDVKLKLKRKNQLLFSRDSDCLQPLLRCMRKQRHRTLVLWTFRCADVLVNDLNKRYPDETRLADAVRLSKDWAFGRVKMPIARRAILQAHAVAKQLNDPFDQALCHAIGHACGSVHVETHAIGLPIYELSAIVRRVGIDRCEQPVAEKIRFYMETLEQCIAAIDQESLTWANFLLNDKHINKEQLLFEKRQSKTSGKNA